jgi:FKBP-type peptidyl-prolyl cis-trans isomerase
MVGAMNDEAQRKSGSAPKKKKKKRKKARSPDETRPASGAVDQPLRASDASPAGRPGESKTPIGTIAVVCVVGAALGALFYDGALRSKAAATASSASAGEASSPTATPSDVAAPPSDAKTTASGLAYRTLRAGDGKTHPKPTDRVRVHYAGWTKDGKLFDSSYTRGEPATFGVTEVIKGWTEGLQLMSVGEKARFWIPGALAYGDAAQGGKPSGQLTFDVELLAITN